MYINACPGDGIGSHHRYQLGAMVPQLERHTGFNCSHRAYLGTGHTVPAIARFPAIRFAVITEGHQVTRANLLAKRFILGLTSVTLYEVDSWSHIVVLPGG